jgi:hypothetical protein
MNNDAAAKIAMLKDSMRCFIYGLLGFLPVIGLPFGIAALWIAGRVRIREKKYWNAAKPYRIWGGVCAGFGTIFCNGPIIISLTYNFTVAVKYLYYGSD